ncbi:MAG: bifunctional phosphopantothenoylcysteine decarboxylase/phosphopantothenate--cysteine ligase CoaBC [Deltaproteobacteria bacterium]
MAGKRIIIGVTASIAAYKAAYLVRYFIKNDFEVKVIMTPAAVDFITPLTLGVLSKNKVLVNFSDDQEWNSHVEFGLWADYFLIAPASANTLAKMAHGIADNLLLTTYLSARCRVGVAPAMDMDMWKSKSVGENIKKLKSHGVDVFDVESGELASGLIGEGRMMDPESLFQMVVTCLNKKDLEGKKILITSGPTYEYIDPVRFIGNNSSGKMGIALANDCIKRGASVVLISGPVSIPLPAGAEICKVTSASEMYDAVLKYYSEMDIIIFAAAVADYTPEEISVKKIKKSDNDLVIKLKNSTDIAASIGSMKKDGQIFVGFALETNDELEHAQKKLKSKNLDLIVLNSLNDNGAGFGFDTNKITIISGKDNKIKNFELKEKDKVAQDIIDEIVSLF